ncbi:S16 family serine protease [Streptomyces litchfieldiae]|uniref:S16 family serine protease n=1 Tax=Streptomyces litchfieldiae TaxID=3075543 RepID=A0ABU2MN08_9ACTN|nr:S16 family serine protease [Streptomyces sp. DSM 44938]MDT0342994.1 S16 family serine protease [Streptomyces sp. DSM 44938]
MPAAPTAPTEPDPAAPSPPTGRRPLVLAACGALVAALLAVAALAPLPYSVTHPGLTADVLGEHAGEQVITITGAQVRDPEGELRMTTITATGPDATVRLSDVISGYFAGDRAVMPRESVYPVGDTTEEIQEHNTAQMRESQNTAVTAALSYLGMAGDGIEVEVDLGDVGGPSAGLLLSLGIVDLLAGDGEGGDLTGGLTIAGTGTIDADGTVGAVGGVPLKTQAARRDGATVFLVPRDECSDATADLPDGLRLIPVTTLEGAVDSLRALAAGESVPSC